MLFMFRYTSQAWREMGLPFYTAYAIQILITSNFKQLYFCIFNNVARLYNGEKDFQFLDTWLQIVRPAREMWNLCKAFPAVWPYCRITISNELVCEFFRYVGLPPMGQIDLFRRLGLCTAQVQLQQELEGWTILEGNLWQACQLRARVYKYKKAYVS